MATAGTTSATATATSGARWGTGGGSGSTTTAAALARGTTGAATARVFLGSSLVGITPVVRGVEPATFENNACPGAKQPGDLAIAALLRALLQMRIFHGLKNLIGAFAFFAVVVVGRHGVRKRKVKWGEWK